jgi:hypothetical protein
MRTTDDLNAKFSAILDDAQTAMDEVRRQQREKGGFDHESHVRVASRVGVMTGFHQALLAAEFTEMPRELLERMGQIAEDARALRYRSERPGT